MKIIIIGGGASGLYLASLLKKYDIHDVTILEKNEKVGKKLLLTGNGRCNLANKKVIKNCYNNSFAYRVVKNYDYGNVSSYFENLGLLTYEDQEGRIYPISNTANTVLDVLRYNIDAKILTNCTLLEVKHLKSKYYLKTTNGDYECDILVMASGGNSYCKSNNTYQILKSLNHTIIPIRPSLIGLKCQEDLSSIANLRVKAIANLFQNNELVHRDRGEVLFKKDGLSGIVIFQLSHFYKEDKDSYVSLELLPDYGLFELQEMLQKLNNKYNDPKKTLSLLFPKMIAYYILKSTNDYSYYGLSMAIKDLKFKITSTYGFETCQVSKGGVSVDEVNEDSFESKINPNLYIIGECLDVNGLCGGYNLNFAFASAFVSAKGIKKRVEENEKE